MVFRPGSGVLVVAPHGDVQRIRVTADTRSGSSLGRRRDRGAVTSRSYPRLAQKYSPLVPVLRELMLRPDTAGRQHQDHDRRGARHRLGPVRAIWCGADADGEHPPQRAARAALECADPARDAGRRDSAARRDRVAREFTIWLTDRAYQNPPARCQEPDF